MNERSTFLEKMRGILLSKRKELTDLMNSASEEKLSDNEARDSADEAYSSNMSKLQSSLQEAEIAEVKLIDEALVRIKRNEYGVCIDCGESISTQRLEYYPYAARCIACQEALER